LGNSSSIGLTICTGKEFFSNAWDQNQSLIHAGQVLYLWAISPAKNFLLLEPLMENKAQLPVLCGKKNLPELIASFSKLQILRSCTRSRI
jgi:hypothetical protein